MDSNASFILVTFATEGFEAARERLIQSALGNSACDSVVRWTPASLQKTGHAGVEVINFAERGAGFWAWKPLIILMALEAARAEQWILYCDVGRGDGFRIPPDIEPLFAWAAGNNDCLPGVYVPEVGPNRWWTKRDAFVLMECDLPKFHNCVQIQATYSLWKKTDANIQFVRKWLDFCLDRRIVSDDDNTCGLSNLPGFYDHRHDQSILTNLCLQTGRCAFGAPHVRTENSKQISSLLDRLEGRRATQRYLKWRRYARYAARSLPLVSRLLETRSPMAAAERELLRRGFWL